MEKVTKERELTAKENEIKSLISSNDKRFTDAFNFICKHYYLDYVMGKSNYFLVFKAIYIDNSDLPKWKMANYCNVARSSLFDYRHEIINCFYTYLKENITMEEIAVTKG